MKSSAKSDGCIIFLYIIILGLASIGVAFDGNFVPILIIVAISSILWIYVQYKKSQHNRKIISETVKGKIEIQKSNSKLFIIILIIIFGVMLSLIFQFKKKEYFENQNNQLNEQNVNLPANFQNNIFIDTTANKIINEETNLITNNHFGYSFQLPKNLLKNDALTNEKFSLYLDSELCLSLSIASENINKENINISIDQFKGKLSEYAINFNNNNRKSFDDFKLIDYQISKFGNMKAIKITQTSKKVSGKNIEMLVISFNVIAKPNFYDITYSYPKDSLKYNILFEQIDKSFKFNSN